MTTGGQPTYYSMKDVAANIKLFVKYLFKKWWLLALALIAGAGMGTAFYLSQKPRYEAVTTFILEEKSAGGGGIASLASQFGFDVGSLSGGGGSLFAGDNILDILKSKRIISKVLLSKSNQPPSANVTLADMFLDFSGWRSKWKNNTALAQALFDKLGGDARLSSLQDSVLNLVQAYLIKNALVADRKNKKGSIITVTLAAANPVFARLFSERVVEEALRFYLDVKTGVAQSNIANMQRRADSLLYLLNRKSYAVAGTQLLDINPGFKSAAVPTEILGRDKMVLSTLYAEVTKNLEASKLILSQQTPVIQILDKPDELLQDKKMGLTLLAFAMAAAIFIIVALYLLGSFILSDTPR